MTPQSSGSPPSGSSGAGRGGAQVATPVVTGLIGRYQILDRIGEGGMGSLFLARDPAIDRLVAIKLLRRGFDTEPLRERFAREARAAGRLRHPHIVTVFDVGEHDGDPFIAMEFLAGETLAELIRDGARLSLSRRLKLLEELCDGLAYAHRAGLVHRDIKPANLMVDADGVLKILDFGIVRVTDSGMTQAGMLVGTVNYMSPEQVVGSPVDHRSDIFSVGLVAYELISGKQAFPGTMKDGLLNKILNGDVVPLPEVVPGIDVDVVSIVGQALQKDPAERYQDLVRMRNDLARTRSRIEREEELAAVAAAAEAGETAVIGEHPTLAVEPPHPSSPGLVHDAETALAAGNYRAALTLAGRSAAINPQDRTASSVAARAEAALLDRGRQLTTAPLVTPPVAPVSSNVPIESPASSSSRIQRGARHVTWIAVAIAIAAIGIAVAALWLRNSAGDSARVAADKPQATPEISEVKPAPPPPAASASPSQPVPSPPVSSGSTDADAKAASAPSTPAASPAPPEVEAREPERPAAARGAPARGRATPPDPRTTPPDRRPTAGSRSSPPPMPAPIAPAPATPPTAPAPSGAASTPPPVPERPAGPLRAGVDISAPKQTKYLEPEPKGSGGTVRIDLTIDPNGHVTDPRVLRSVPGLEQSALAAVRNWEFAPPRLNGEPVTVMWAVDVKVPPVPEPKPAPPSPPPTAPKAPDSAKTAPAPAADPRAEIETVLRRYKDAWESLNAEALEQVQVLSPADAAVVRSTMSAASQYRVDLTVKAVNVDASGKTAAVQVVLIRRFTPKIGRAPGTQTATEIRLAKRGDGWVITNIR